MDSNTRRSRVLKIALFATGLSGIVAEYILATLATYFLYDPVLQFTLIVSIMLFAMGIGSGLSKLIKSNLAESFILIEFILSLLVSFSCLVVYSFASKTAYIWFMIYGMSVLIGLLIGMEIPLVTRINSEYHSLRENIASVMKYDYFGSLVGGVFFAYVGVPIIGLTYTPFLLGAINLIVAILLLIRIRKTLKKRFYNLLAGGALLTAVLITIGVFIAKPVILHGEQKKYKDKVIYQERSKYQKLVITQWENDYWLFINGNLQFSSIDEFLYHEPLIHPVMTAKISPKKVLILGGGDGCAAREILKYESVESIMLVDLDPAMTNLGKDHPVITKINMGSMSDPKMKIMNKDAFDFLENSKDYFDVIVVDLPDPKTLSLNKLYTTEFYNICKHHLVADGYLITQAGSPHYATRAFNCIKNTMAHSGFSILPMQNQILTMGQWGWVVGCSHLNKDQLRKQFQNLDFGEVETRWINTEAMSHLTSFGRDVFNTDSAEVNTMFNPVLYKYYLKGNWDLY